MWPIQQDAEDIVQETLWRAYRQLGRRSTVGATLRMSKRTRGFLVEPAGQLSWLKEVAVDRDHL
jgi:hypothetical protein